MTTHSSDRSESTSEDNRSRRRQSRHRGHGERKERVLHTRISEQLAEDIRLFADDLRVPASNLVRNVLEEVFTMVDNVSEDVGGLMDDLIDEAEGVRDRVRRQARARSGRRSPRSRRRGSRQAKPNDSEVEEELRRDEDTEAGPGDRERKAQTEEEAMAASEQPQGDGTPRPPRAADLFPDILGWQPLVLNRDLGCGRCERLLPAGESAFLGIGTKGLTETALCGKCASERA
jgi:hypothetical protein